MINGGSLPELKQGLLLTRFGAEWWVAEDVRKWLKQYVWHALIRKKNIPNLPPAKVRFRLRRYSLRELSWTGVV
jgi:hypothetical protein